MAKTSLPFYRKNQSLNDMETERPKHMAALREAMLNAASEVEENVKTIEREFCGGRDHEHEVRHMLPSVKHIMDSFDIAYINSAHDLEEVIDFTLEPSEVFQFDMLAVSNVKEYHRKLIEFLPERFENILEDIRRILTHLNMYCLSFCPSHITADSKTRRKNIYLETVFHYAAKRKDYAKTIEMHLRNIETMSKSYRSEDGVGVKVFGLTTNELARRTDSGDVPLLLILPEACFNAFYACAAVRKWVDADKDYNDFVRNDIEHIETRKLEQSKVVQENRLKMGNIDYSTRSTKRSIDHLEGEMANMAKSEQKVLAEIETLETDIKVMYIELDYQEDQRRKYKDNAVKNTQLSEADLVEKLNEISRIIAKTRNDVPETKQKIIIVKNKQRVVIDKRELLNRKITELKELDKQRILSRGYMHEAQSEMEKIDVALSLLKDVYMKKTSSDLTKKIFNSMPVRPRNARHMKRYSRAMKIPTADALERVSRVVAKEIESDWPELYRSLPFYPPRGHAEQDGDIDRTAQRLYRVDDSHKAKETLEKWRTHNTLANVNTLKDTLRKMGKSNIVDTIERKKSKEAHGMTKVHAKHNWKKLKKFKFTLGKIMALQTQTHVNKLDSVTETAQDRSLRHEALFRESEGYGSVKTGKITLKNSNIILKKPQKKRTLPPLDSHRTVKAH